MLTYTRPVVSEFHQRDAARIAAHLINGKSTPDIRKAIAGLLCENMRLTLEVNEHRAARGYEPLPVVEERG